LPLDFLNNGESASERGERFLIVLPDLFNGVLGRDNESLGSNVCRASLSLGDKGKEVGPVFKRCGELSMVDSEIITDDGLFSLITVPPLIDGLEESIGILSICGSGLSASCWSMDPDSARAAELRRSNHVVSGDDLKSAVVPEPKLWLNKRKLSSLGESPGFFIAVLLGLPDLLRRLGWDSKLDELSVFRTVDVVLGEGSFSAFHMHPLQMSTYGGEPTLIVEVQVALQVGGACGRSPLVAIAYVTWVERIEAILVGIGVVWPGELESS